ncbi:ft-interacting protein 1 [Quercus suber]|uniref:Ft-interacting protein 1 n=1 Tax=Quercus suber TaxID=58331 RepID=A0AAW0JJ60_QUESU
MIRVTTLLTGFLTMMNWFKKIRNWTNPASTIFIYILFLLVVFFPQVILLAMFLFLFLTGIWRYRKRPRLPPHVDANLSHAYTANEDELDEEFDSIPSRKTGEVLKWRYDRLRIIAARMQTVLGDLTTHGERLQSLLSWRDPKATAIFVCFSLIVCLVTYKIPFHYMIVLTEISFALTSKLRNHQIFGATKSSTAAAAATIMLQQQLFMSCGAGAGAGAGESGLIQIRFLWVPSTTSLMGPCLSKLRSEF